MTIVLVTAPATEPVTIAEALLHCKVDQSNQELAPGAITAALASPAAVGNVNNGAHRYRVTFVTADGETEGGVISSAVTVADLGVNGQVELTAIPLGGTLVTSRKIYRTAADASSYLLLTTLANNTATIYTDNIADSSLGAGAPTANTTTDPEFSRNITAARLAAEQDLGRRLITQTLAAYYDAFPVYSLFLLPPLSSVTSITYLDTDGASQTLAADQYTVDAKSIPARITPAYGVTWPSTRAQSNAVYVTFVAGYGAASAVPEGIKLWMLMHIKQAFDNRTPMVAGSASNELPRSYVDGLLDPERVYIKI